MAIIHQTEEIVVLSTENSKNPKTGNMVQLYYLLKNHDPSEAFKAAKNVTDGTAIASKVCGGCSHLTDGSCYVLWFQGPLSTWRRYKNGGHDSENPIKATKNKMIRFGAAGNPTVIPFEVNYRIAKRASGWTGYTAEWLTCDPQYSKIFMASVDNITEAKAAQALGYRTFRVRPVGDTSLLPNEIVCPATQPRLKGKVDCATCGLCSGTEGRGHCSIVVDAHGAKKTNFDNSNII